MGPARSAVRATFAKPERLDHVGRHHDSGRGLAGEIDRRFIGRETLSAMQIVRSVVIDCHIEDVFAYVADPLNDPGWCAKVDRVEQVDGDGPGPGARYEVLHRPIPLRPARRMAYACVDWDPPRTIVWREDDGDDVIDVTYELESVWTSTRFTQRDEARLGAPRALHPLLRIGIGRDVMRQLRTLKRVLERRE